MVVLMKNMMMMMLVMVVVGADSRAGAMAKAKALSLLNGLTHPPLTFPQMHSTLCTFQLLRGIKFQINMQIHIKFDFPE